MHWLLRDAVKAAVEAAERGYILRSDEESRRAAEIAREGRVLLLHAASSDEAERWLTGIECPADQAALNGRGRG